MRQYISEVSLRLRRMFHLSILMLVRRKENGKLGDEKRRRRKSFSATGLSLSRTHGRTDDSVGSSPSDLIRRSKTTGCVVSLPPLLFRPIRVLYSKYVSLTSYRRAKVAASGSSIAPCVVARVRITRAFRRRATRLPTSA